MPRKARKKSETGIYHIIMRGINRQTIFEDEKDYAKFIQVIMRYKEESGYKIYAYCLMGNHVHLLLKIGIEPLEQVMRRICGSYVYWYNMKYQRIGNLFQDRFRSEPVENDSYFLIVQRYIHQNPLKAGLVEYIEQYKWSSYKDYLKRSEFVDVNFLLGMFNINREMAINSFHRFNNVVNDDVCLEIEDKLRIKDEEARNLINRVCKVQNPIDLQKLDRLERNTHLKKLKGLHSISIRQIERLTGINRSVVLRA
jgi:REP element-mobilizing transposase RayT